jgi:hypothetical protein
MLLQGYRCNVTGATSIVPVASAQPPVYCRRDADSCVFGGKQMIAWNQTTGENVTAPNGVSPGDNTGMNWVADAQDDIFVPTIADSSTISASVGTATSSSSSSVSMNSSASSLTGVS